jgi:MFS transporter (putative signal transducer)
MDAATPIVRSDHPSFTHVLTAIAGVYTAQSVIGGLTFQSVPAILRNGDASLDAIGAFVFAAMAPWALKFAWAPAVERYRLPRDGRRRSRSVALAGQACVAALLALLALLGSSSALLLPLLLGVGLVSATVDIACDAFAIEQLPPKRRGWGNVAQVGAAYFGMALGGGAFLMIVATAGWTVAALAAASLIAAVTLPFATIIEPDRPHNPDAAHHRPSLRFALARRQIRAGLLLTVVFEAGARLAQGMIGPFLVDAGLDLATIGVLNGLGGTAAGLVGTAIGGSLVRLSGARASVFVAAGLQASSVTALACAAMLHADDRLLLAGLALFQAGAMAAGFVTLYSILMGLSSRLQAGVDFTLFQCADAVVAGFGGMFGGLLAQRLGYSGCFGLAAVAAIAATAAIFVILRRLSPIEKGFSS